MHITISGRLGSGKSTVCKILSEEYGFEIYSTGKIHRQIAAEKGISALEMNELMATDLSFDHMIDGAVTEISKNNIDRTLIFDSRMAWHFACNSFKVFMHIDPAIAAKRVIRDDRGAVEHYKDLDDARRQLLARATSENTRYKRIYNADNLDYCNFDLVVDSATIDPHALAALMLDEFKKYGESAEGYRSPKLMLSPLSIYPTSTVAEMEKDDSELTVAVINGSHFAVGGGKKLLKAMAEKPSVIMASLADRMNTKPAEARIAAMPADKTAVLREFEEKFGFSFPEIAEIYR